MILIVDTMYIISISIISMTNESVMTFIHMYINIKTCVCLSVNTPITYIFLWITILVHNDL